MSAVVSSADISPDSRSPSNYQQAHDALEALGWDTVEAVFTSPSPQVTLASVRGDIRRSSFWEQNHGDLKSFVVKSPDGDVVRVSIEDESMSVHCQGTHLAEDFSPEVVDELGLSHFLGVCVMVSFQSVDEYIDRNGLRPVVNEVKRRRWAIMMSLALFAAVCQAIGL